MFDKKNQKTTLLIAIFIFLAVKELLFVISIPPWQGHDEPAHFSYTQFLVEEKKLPSQSEAIKPKTLSYSAEYAASEIATDVTRLMNAHNKQLRLIHQRFNNTFLQYQTLAAQYTGLSRHPLQRSSAPAEFTDIYYRLSDQDIYQNSAAVYPPLYYAVEAIPYLIVYKADILTRLMAMRLFSSFLYLVALWIGYLLMRRITKRFFISITVVLLAGLLPVFSHLAAGVNNEILLFLLTTLTLYWLVRLNEHVSWPLTALLGLTLGMGLMTKPQFVVFLPLAVLPYVFHIWIKKDLRWKTALPMLITVGLITLVIGGWWYAWAVGQHNGIVPAAVGTTSISHIGVRAALPYILHRWLYAFVSFNFAFGFATEMVIPIWLFTVGVTLWMLAAPGFLVWLFRKWKCQLPDTRLNVIVMSGATLLLELFLLYLFVRGLIANGTARFPIDGRYYVLVLFPICLAFVWGLSYWLPPRWKKIAYITCLLYAVTINAVALVNIIWPH
ncbi:MAG: glycosyltransferase family 39 protein, partial [Parcubacteria group bacterium]